MSCVCVGVDWFGSTLSPSTSVYLLSLGYPFQFAFRASPSGSTVASLSLCYSAKRLVSRSSYPLSVDSSVPLRRQRPVLHYQPREASQCVQHRQDSIRIFPASKTPVYTRPLLFFLFRNLWVRVGKTSILHTYIRQYINPSQWWTLYAWSTSCPMYHSHHMCIEPLSLTPVHRVIPSCFDE